MKPSVVAIFLVLGSFSRTAMSCLSHAFTDPIGAKPRTDAIFVATVPDISAQDGVVAARLDVETA